MTAPDELDGRTVASLRPGVVEIVSDPNRSTQLRIAVGGVDLARVVTAGRLEFSGGELPHLTLEIPVLHLLAKAELGVCDINLADATRDLLIALGWTPPPTVAPATATPEEPS